MRTALIQLRKFAILCHRWMGVAFCVLFAWWFASGIFMMYWDFPSVGQEDRLARSQPIDPDKIQLSPQEAYAKLGEDRPPAGASVAVLAGRPVYRFRTGGGRRSQTLVYADDGTTQGTYSKELIERIASDWSGQPAGSARVESVTEVDQWTVQGGLRNLRPLWKYSFPDGQQVYVSEVSGEVVQATTTGSRLGAYLGPIPHWLYFTPLRTKQKLWTNLIVWASGIGTVMALLGLIVGISLYAPSKKYRFADAPSSIPYQGQKRLHMILGLFFGIVTCTWAFSGMLSMEPFPMQTDRGKSDGNEGPAERVQAAFRPRRLPFADFSGKSPREALMQLGLKVKQLDLTSFDGHALYMASLGPGQTRIIPVHGEPQAEFDYERLLEMARRAAQPVGLAEARMLTRYDSYYLDRLRERPLPVMFVRFNDPEHTQLYIDQRTARIVGEHSDESSFMTRWLYHGLHSWNFPWLYNHRPAWDIVVLFLMLGGLTLCVTSMLIGWQLLRRKF